MQQYELKRRARGLIREYAPRIFFISAIYVVISTVLSELQYRLPNVSGAFDSALEKLYAGQLPAFSLLFDGLKPVGTILTVLLIIMTPVVTAGFMSYCLKISRDLNADYGNLFDGFAVFPKILLISIVTRVFIILWSLLLFFPGIVASYRYRQAYYILLENPEKGVMQCIRESKRLMRGRKIDLFFLDLSFLGWLLLDVIISIALSFPLPIVSIFWLEPYAGISRAGFYNDLIGRDPPLPYREREF